jgi:hypothetical protein
MKKQLGGLFFLIALAFSLSAQTGAQGDRAWDWAALGSAVSLPQGTAEVKDFFYHITSDGGTADAAAVIREMELRFAVYNQLFRFDPSHLSSPLKVQVFHRQEDYDEYVSSRLGRTRAGAVYLHYAQPDRRELVIHRGSPEAENMLPHQAFIQFLRAFVSNPPAWIREGFAIYFSRLGYDERTGELLYEEDLSWLDQIKTLGSEAPSLEAVLLADSIGIPEHFQSAAWALASFFVNNNQEEYFRTLTELFMALSDSVTAQANAETVMRRIVLWTDLNTLQRDYESYLGAQKTFAELIQEGQDAYAEKDPATAKLYFMAALTQRRAHYAPYYYLGLLAYEAEDYNLAEQYYRSAIQFGADAALVLYALGLNAVSAGRNPDAIGYLEQAAASSPERYQERAAALIAQLRENN